MRRTPWTIYMWPGLPQIWQHGSWFGLAIAVAAAGLLNFGLVAGFGFRELVDPSVRIGVWAAVGVVWAVSAAVSYVSIRRQAVLQEQRCRRREASDDAASDAVSRQTTPDAATFSRAIEQYLRGDWFEAERLWGVLLKANPRDIEARLMRATLYRHTKRLEEATEQLTLLERFEGAEAWEFEIRRERELLLEACEDEACEDEAREDEAREDGTSEDGTPEDGACDDTIEPTEQEANANSVDPPTEEMRAA